MRTVEVKKLDWTNLPLALSSNPARILVDELPPRDMLDVLHKMGLCIELNPHIEPAFLHVYAQGMQHDEAVIVGNINGLKLLREAIDAAISDQQHGSTDVFTSDGEGYTLHILRANEAEANNLELPYTDEMAGANQRDYIRISDVYTRVM